MSVLVIGRMPVDTANVEQLWKERPADFEAVAAEAKTVGAIHHRWGFGNGELVIIAEWDSVESFQKFFESNETIPQLMQAAGVQGQPTFDFFDAKAGPDEF